MVSAGWQRPVPWFRARWDTGLAQNDKGSQKGSPFLADIGGICGIYGEAITDECQAAP
jgi:hypothetical protein